MLHGQKSKIGEVFAQVWRYNVLRATRERKTFVRKTDRPGVSFLLTKSNVPDN